MIRMILLGVLLGSFALLFTPNTANAEFRVCNDTNTKIEVSLGVRDKNTKEIATLGWLEIGPQKCQLQGEIGSSLDPYDAGYVTARIPNDVTSIWTVYHYLPSQGSRELCVDTAKPTLLKPTVSFSHMSSQPCKKPDSTQAGSFYSKIDTFKEVPFFEVNLERIKTLDIRIRHSDASKIPIINANGTRWTKTKPAPPPPQPRGRTRATPDPLAGMSETDKDLALILGGLALLYAVTSGPDEDEKCMRECQKNKSKSYCVRQCSVD